jgi:hypothetical protein
MPYEMHKHHGDKHTVDASFICHDRSVAQENHVAENLNERQTSLSMSNNSKYLRFLPEDFTIDETIGLTEAAIEPLSGDILRCMRTVAEKLNHRNSNLSIQLTSDESRFIK